MLPKPYLIYLGSSKTKIGAKIADALVTWRKSDISAYYSLPDCDVSYDFPFVTPEEASALGIKSMVIAFTNSGGFLVQDDIIIAERALRSGLDVISGMHVKLEDYPEIALACKETSSKVYNIRFCNTELTTDDAKRRSGKRILTIGTDCSVGKMYTSLALTRQMKKKQTILSILSESKQNILWGIKRFNCLSHYI